MKASIILTLPVLALAAATPVKVEKRQFNPLPCLQEIQGLADCIDPEFLADNPFALFGVVLWQVTLLEFDF
ncbi:unnamed protein product [Fusarium equiseti]|uniref:Small secreted protein n=1 Tax=Fusarium equiseti TaxID=61235 RepID=A0A8J2J7P9_FUSEQ|nr:unnamed protein product [Fusarium equiseti]